MSKELPAGYAHEEALRIAAPLDQVTHDEKSAFVMRTGNEWFALPVTAIEQTATGATLHSIPHRRGGALLGLCSIQGDLLPAVSLPLLLGIDAAPPSLNRLVIFRHGNVRVAMPADEVWGIHRYTPADLVPLPSTLDAERNYTIDLFKWRDTQVALLDAERLVKRIREAVL